MARRIAVLGVALLLTCGAAWAAQAPEAGAKAPPAPATLTLDQAVKTALENNPGLRLSREAVRKAAAVRAQANAYLQPELTLHASQTEMGPIASLTIPGQAGSIQLGTPEVRSASLEVTQIFDVLHVSARAIKITDFYLQAAQLDLGRAQQKVAFAAEQTYFGVLEAQALRDVAKEALQADEEHLGVARLQYEAGTVPHFDVLRAEVAVADAQQRVVAASNGVDLAKSALNNVLGADVSQPLEVLPMPDYTPVELDLAPLLAQAERSRLELQSADLQIAAADRMIFVARRGSLPSVNLTGSYNWSEPASTFSPNTLSWTVALAATVPIFQAQTRPLVEQARSDLRSAQAAREQLRQGIALEVRQAYLSLREAQTRLLATAKTVDEAREAVRLAQVRYEAGVGTALEVTDVVAALTGAGTNHINAVYDSRISLARLENAVGAPLNQGARQPAP